MREIKFRAWLKESCLEKHGYYKYEVYKEKIDKLGRMRKVHSIHLNKESIIISSAWGGNIGVLIDDVELMQYTGLRDKNGVKIFEGDIIEYWYRSVSGTASSTAIVKFYDGAFQLEDIDDSDTTELLYLAEDLKVIGNVWENPELLEFEDDDDDDDDDEFWKVIETLDTIED